MFGIGPVEILVIAGIGIGPVLAGIYLALRLALKRT